MCNLISLAWTIPLFEVLFLPAVLDKVWLKPGVHIPFIKKEAVPIFHFYYVNQPDTQEM